MKMFALAFGLILASCASTSPDYTRLFCLPRASEASPWRHIDPPESASELMRRARLAELGDAKGGAYIGWYEDGAGRVGVCEMEAPAISNFVIFIDQTPNAAIVDHGQELTLIE